MIVRQPLVCEYEASYSGEGLFLFSTNKCFGTFNDTVFALWISVYG